MSNTGKRMLKIYSDKDDKYYIGFEYHHPQFNIDFITSERFSRAEAQARVIRMAVDLEADTDNIVLSN